MSSNEEGDVLVEAGNGRLQPGKMIQEAVSDLGHVGLSQACQFLLAGGDELVAAFVQQGQLLAMRIIGSSNAPALST